MSQATVASPPAAPVPGRASRFAGNPWLTLVVVALGVAMVALDSTVVAIANPAIQRDLNASLSDLQWVTNGYLLALAVFLITAGKLGDRFGHRRLFMIGVVGFAATSAAIGFSGSINTVIAFRVLQGIFGALMQPAALGLLRAAFPPDKLNIAIGIWAGAIGASTGAGPIIGGVLIEHVNWQSVFFINVPVAIAAIVLGLFVLGPNRPTLKASSFDIPGIALLSVAMFMLIWGLIKAPEWGWDDAGTIGFLAGALIVAVLFVLRERAAKEPLLPLSLFANRSLSAGTVLMVLMAFAMFGAMFFVTFYLQSVHGLSPVESGVRTLPLTAAMIIGAPLAGAIIAKVGPRWPVFIGLLLAGASMFGLASLDYGSSTNEAALWFFPLGLGLSAVMVGATEAIVGNAPLEDAGVASGLQQSAMQVGGALGTAVLGAVMTSRIASVFSDNLVAGGLPPAGAEEVEVAKSAIAAGVAPVPPGASEQVASAVTQAAHLSFMSGMSLAFTIAGVVAVVGSFIALFIRKGENDSGPVVHV